MTCAAADGTVILTWTNPTGGVAQTGYQVSRYISGYDNNIPAYFNCDSYDTSGACTTSSKYSDSELQSGVTYTYSVRLVKRADGATPLFSGWSNSVDVEIPSANTVSYPAAPTGVSASEVLHASDDAKITISWTAVSDATSYSIYRNGRSLTTGLTKTSYDDTDIAAGRAYIYAVYAVNSHGTSPPSSLFPVNTTELVYGLPGIIAGSDLTETYAEATTSLTLSWTAPDGTPTKYMIYQGKYTEDQVRAWENPENMTFPVVAVNDNVTTTSWTTTLEDDHYYIFAIGACNTSGCSVPSQSFHKDLIGIDSLEADSNAPDTPTSPSGE